MEEELYNSLEYTPTWIVAVICSIIVFISLCVERALHRLGKWLEKKNQNAINAALQKLKDELMLLGFISLLLTVAQGFISHICISPHLVTHMLPCKKPNDHGSGSSQGSEHKLIYYGTIPNRRNLLSTDTGSEHCRTKGKVPLLSLESLHHLHIFIFVLAVVHVVFCVITMLLGSARIQQWKSWENNIRAKIDTQYLHHHEFFKKRANGYWRRAAVVGWLIAFCKQFYGSVTESDYLALRHGFILENNKEPSFDFHKHMVKTLEDDFRKVVGISWYMWLFVVLFLLLNIQGWHTYFWLAFLPLILLLLVGAKLEHIIARLAQEPEQKSQQTRVKPSNEFFWFNSPALVLHLIHFILFQNSFEIAFFFWIWSTYGFDSCIMEKIYYIVPRLIMGVIVQVLCSSSTLPLYALVTKMGSRSMTGMFGKEVGSSISNWIQGEKGGNTSGSAGTGRNLLQKMVKEPTKDAQTAEQAIIMVEETAASSSVELPCISQAP